MPAVFLTETASLPAGVPTAPAETGALVEVLSQVRGDVVLVATDTKGAAAARSARFALGGGSIGLLSLDLPPTLVFVLAAASAMVPDYALGYLPGVFARVTAQTRTLAVLSSVAGLRTPAPSRGQVARSLTPGSGGFVVDWQASTVTSGRAITLPPHAWGCQAGSARPPAVSKTGWSDQLVGLTTSSSFWGDRRWLEVTAVAQPLPAMLDSLFTVMPPDAVQCRSCTRVAARGTCVFCQVSTTEAYGPAMDGARR